MTLWKLSAKCCALPRADVLWRTGTAENVLPAANAGSFAWDLSPRGNKLVPRKDNWAFLALSLFGDETTARDLTTQILAWPQEGKSARAVSGLNILTLMNNDMALIQLHHISQRAKSAPYVITRRNFFRWSQKIAG